MRTFNKPTSTNPSLHIGKKSHWKLWLLFGIFMISLIAMAGYGVKSFFSIYYIASPIQTRPVKITNPEFKNVKPKKQAIKVVEPVYASVTHYEVSDIVDKIFTLESSRGVNDGCRDKGLYNGYGFMQSTFYWNCYSNQEEVVNLVTNWVQDKRDKGFSTAEIYCYYNVGIKENDCPYYRNAISL